MIDENKFQATYKIPNNDNLESGHKKKKKNNISTPQNQQIDSSGHTWRLPKKNKKRRDSCIDGLDLNVIRGINKPVSYNLNSGLEMT
jgi:hypothetical protein